MRSNRIESEDEVILEPAAGRADAAVIWLHGLGADGYDFVPLIPQLKLPATARVRFVFPHAEVRPVTVNAGYAMRAWYDIRELTPEGRDDEAGLAATRERIERYIERERAGGIAARRIVLAGFSQGGAAALHVGLRHGAALGGIIALSAYLPLRARRLRAGTGGRESCDAGADVPWPRGCGGAADFRRAVARCPARSRREGGMARIFHGPQPHRA